MGSGGRREIVRKSSVNDNDVLQHAVPGHELEHWNGIGASQELQHFLCNALG